MSIFQLWDESSSGRGGGGGGGLMHEIKIPQQDFVPNMQGGGGGGGGGRICRTLR